MVGIVEREEVEGLWVSQRQEQSNCIVKVYLLAYRPPHCK